MVELAVNNILPGSVIYTPPIYAAAVAVTPAAASPTDDSGAYSETLFDVASLGPPVPRFRSSFIMENFTELGHNRVVH